jgi:hypothetical protein
MLPCGADRERARPGHRLRGGRGGRRRRRRGPGGHRGRRPRPRSGRTTPAGAAPTVYVAYPNPGKVGTITPISIASNTPRKPIRLRFNGETAITPDGKTLYAAAVNKVVPISTATNTPGKPIRRVGYRFPTHIVITP